MSHSAPFQGSVCGPLGRNRRIHRHANLAPALACVAISLGLSAAAHAAPIIWIGGNADWDATNANWNPTTSRTPTTRRSSIRRTPSTSQCDGSRFMALTLSGGIDLLTNGNDLIVDGLVQLVDASTVLIIGGSTSLLTADSMTINTGGTVRLTGGTLDDRRGDGYREF